MNNLPIFFDKQRICIICEGNEEYFYLDRLKELQVWNEQYHIELVNANGNGNIPARYKTAIIVTHMILFLYSAIQKKSHMNSTMT